MSEQFSADEREAIREAAAETKERRRKANEARRVVLVKERDVLCKARRTEAAATSAEADGHRSSVAKAQADFDAKVSARNAVLTRELGESLAFDHRVGKLTRELRALADPLLPEFRGWLLREDDRLRYFPISGQEDMHEIPSPVPRSNAMIKVVHRMLSDSPSVERRRNAVHKALVRVEELFETAGVHVGKEIEKLRASISEIEPAELVLDKGVPVSPRRFELGADEPIAAPPPFATAWRDGTPVSTEAPSSGGATR